MDIRAAEILRCAKPAWLNSRQSVALQSAAPHFRASSRLPQVRVAAPRSNG